MDQEFQIDKEAIRRSAREAIELGAITPEYKGNAQTVCRVLNEALATELVCVLRYKEHYHAAVGLNSLSVAEEFLEHAREEQDHADRLAHRIAQLGGSPEMAPEILKDRSHTEYVKGTSLIQMIEENLVAERIVIEGYNQMIRAIGDTDPTTRRLLEQLLEDEEEHADELKDLLGKLATKEDHFRKEHDHHVH